jgi:hypothetical protein
VFQNDHSLSQLCPDSQSVTHLLREIMPNSFFDNILLGIIGTLEVNRIEYICGDLIFEE